MIFKRNSSYDMPVYLSNGIEPVAKIVVSGNVVYNNFNIENPLVRLYEQKADKTYCNGYAAKAYPSGDTSTNFNLGKNLSVLDAHNGAIRIVSTTTTYWKQLSPSSDKYSTFVKSYFDTNVKYFWTFKNNKQYSDWAEWPNPVQVYSKGADKIIVSSSTEYYNYQNVSSGKSFTLIYNLIPQTDYTLLFYKNNTQLSSTTFTTEGRVRMIKCDVVRNMRDLGGRKTTDGKYTKYGKVFRGSYPGYYYNYTNRTYVNASGETITKKGTSIQPMTNTDIHTFKTVLGINYWVDLVGQTTPTVTNTGITDVARTTSNCYIDLSTSRAYTANTPNNTSIRYFGKSSSVGYSATLENDGTIKTNNQTNFSQVYSAICRDDVVYFHCLVGADRTGTMSALILAACDVCEEDIIKDWEETSFCSLNETHNYYVYDVRAISYPHHEFGAWAYNMQERFQTTSSSLTENIKQVWEILFPGSGKTICNNIKNKLV